MDRLNYKSELKSVFYFILSTIAVLAMNCKMECVDGAETSIILNGLYKLYNSFDSYNFADVFMVVALYVLIRYIKKEAMGYDKWISVLAALLSISYVVSMSYSKYDSAAFLLENSYQMILSVICMLGYYILFYYSLCLLLICINKNKKDILVSTETDCLHRHVWLVGFLFIFISWLPWILMNYPGTSTPDATSQLNQYFGNATFTAHHPPLSTFIMGTCIVLGDFVLDVNFGFFLYILLQTILGALIFSYSIRKMYDLGIPLKACFIGILFFAFFPLWGSVAQDNNKDFLYTEIITLFVICLVNIIIQRKCSKKDGIILFLAGIFASLLRNNGIYAVLPTMIILCIYLKKIERKRIGIALGATVIVYYGIVKMLYPGMGIQDGSVREALSIPFLQTARYVDMYETEVTEYEREVIDSVLDYEALETYNPKHADSVKNTYKNDDSKLPEYFKVWFQMFLKHPECYVSGFLNKAGGYLAPVYAGLPSPIGTEFDDCITSLGASHIFGERFTKLFVHLEYAILELPIIKYFCMAGTYTWILLICMMLLIREKIYSGLILLVPEIMNLLVCIASPTWHIRYALPVIAVLPLMVGWTVYCLKDKR